MIVKIHTEKSSDCKAFKLYSKFKRMLLVTIDSCKEIKFAKKMCLFNTNYKVLSFSSMHSSKIVQTTFNYKRNYYTSFNGSTPELSNVSKLQKISVILFVEDINKHDEQDYSNQIFKKSSLDTFTREAYKFIDNE